MDQVALGARGATSRSVRLFLPNGTAHGLVVAEIINWTGKALAAPRGRLPELLKRAEASRTGVYVLTGPDPDRAGGLKVYIGEGDSVAARLRIHLRSEDKDFFDRLVIIVSTDDNLTKAHVRYLESQLIRLTRQSGVVALANETEPDFLRLPEADRADMDYFVDQLRLVLPILGFDLFRSSPGKPPEANDRPGETIFAFNTAGASAMARETDDGFVVLAGSTARRAGTDTFPAGYRALRDQLILDGRLGYGATPDLYRFAGRRNVRQPERRRVDRCGAQCQWSARMEGHHNRADVSRLACWPVGVAVDGLLH